MRRITTGLQENGRLDGVLDDLVTGKTDPAAAAHMLAGTTRGAACSALFATANRPGKQHPSRTKAQLPGAPTIVQGSPECRNE